jgi:hypothetical protein
MSAAARAPTGWSAQEADASSVGVTGRQLGFLIFQRLAFPTLRETSYCFLAAALDACR